MENIHESEENKINENEHGMKGSGDEAELDKADNDTDAAGNEAGLNVDVMNDFGGVYDFKDNKAT